MWTCNTFVLCNSTDTTGQTTHSTGTGSNILHFSQNPGVSVYDWGEVIKSMPMKMSRSTISHRVSLHHSGDGRAAMCVPGMQDESVLFQT